MTWAGVSMTLLMLIGVLLILIILLQRGRGGGLVGAFGGMGGQSAFGTKAGDVFTKITIVLAVIWVILAGLSGFALRAGSEKIFQPEEQVAPLDDDFETNQLTNANGDKKTIEIGKNAADDSVENGTEPSDNDTQQDK